jgi:hypothetical protein
MDSKIVTSSEYEAEANRLRAQIGATVDALNDRLTPSKLASEVASSVGIVDMSWSGAFHYASRRHPVPTAIIGLGIGLWALAALRKRSRDENTAVLAAPMRESAESIVDSATRVLRQRAEAKRRQFVDIAQAHVAKGAATLSDEIEKKLETVIDSVPGGTSARPLIQSSIQVALAAALEGLLRRPSRI